MKYPHPCCWCGVCCLCETCPVGQAIYKVDKHDLCPGLSFKGDKAICEIIKTAPEPFKVYMGKGAGCCIKARAFRDGQQYDFASLPVELKQAAAKQEREKLVNEDRKRR